MYVCVFIFPNQRLKINPEKTTVCKTKLFTDSEAELRENIVRKRGPTQPRLM